MTRHVWAALARDGHRIVDDLDWLHVGFILVMLLPLVTLPLVRLLRVPQRRP